MKNQNTFKVSVLIATADRSFLIEKCLESLINQIIKPIEIIVIDQSSDQKTYSICEQFSKVKYLKSNRKNKSASINLGISHSKGDYIAIIDDDCIADENWIMQLVKLFNENPHSIITGIVVAGDIEENAKRSRLDDKLMTSKVFKKGLIIPIFIFSGCNCAFNRSVVDSIGFFDTDFGPGSKFLSSDDNEWSFRALLYGYQILYSPKPKVIHRSWRNEKEDAKQMKDYGYAAGAFFFKIWESSKLSFIFHSIKLFKWLWWGQLRYLRNPAKQEPYNEYSQEFFKGFRDYKKHYYNE